jgi:nucleotide-binding universal stress UspA family protein
MYNLIIVALDGSQHSHKALDVACDLGEKYHAKLILLHAYQSTSDLRGTDEFNQLVAIRKGAGEEIIRDARQQMGSPSIEIEEDLLEGPAADAIVRVAQTRKADLVVMGTRGRGSFKGLLFGSVSTKVTHYAPCDVLVVR